MDVPPWENVLFLRDAPCRRFINRRSKFSLALSLSFSVSFSSGRREITESLWVSCGCATPRAALRLLISTFRGLNIVRYIFCGLSAEGGGREEICFTPSIFTFVFSSSPVRISNNASSSSRKGNREEPFREREGYKNYGNGAMIEDKGYGRNRWRIESPVKIASKICTIPAPLSRRLDSRTASCDPTRLHRSCNLQILAKVRGRNLFHRSFPSREISTGCFLHALLTSKLSNTRLIEHSFEFEIHFELRGEKIVCVEKRCLLIC